jgi:formamidopyrimidine-DNA glycosylase
LATGSQTKSSTKPAYIQVSSNKVLCPGGIVSIHTDPWTEQYSNTFNDDQIKALHDSIISICTTACETLADSAQFPETWLMKYRWDKGKKDSNVLPNGEKIVHLKVGGRTSAIVPSVQKKTAAVAGDIDSAEVSETEKPAKGGRKRKVKAEEDESEDVDEKPVAKKTAAKGRGKAKNVKAESDGEDANGGAEAVDDVKTSKTKTNSKKEAKPAIPGSRRSARTKAA